MRKNSGLSLVEVLLSLALSITAGLVLLALVRQFQTWNGNLGLLMERDERLRQAPLLLCRYLTAAGNNAVQADWEGLEAAAGQLAVRSDLSGKNGFPDSQLDDPYESIVLRLQGGHLQIRSGAGRYQPLLKNIRAFEVTEWRPPLLRLRLETETAGELRQVGQKAFAPVNLGFYLWNYRPNLFREERR